MLGLWVIAKSYQPYPLNALFFFAPTACTRFAFVPSYLFSGCGTVCMAQLRFLRLETLLLIIIKVENKFKEEGIIMMIMIMMIMVIMIIKIIVSRLIVMYLYNKMCAQNHILIGISRCC